jgi:hypothetical protein
MTLDGKKMQNGLAVMERVPKCMKAVVFPAAYEAFPRTPDAGAFEALWEASRPAVLANMSHLVYHDASTVAEVMGRLGAHDTTFFDHRGAQAFLAQWPDKSILVFRGTEIGDLRDAVADLKFFKESHGEARIHRGFRQHLDLLWEEHLVPALEALPTDKVLITGHSLGGAMAAVAGTRRPFAEVVTFGAPRVGTGIAKVFQAKRHVRYVNGRDPITIVPPKSLGFEHHGEEIRLIDPDGSSIQYDHGIIYYAEILEMQSP